MVRWKKCGSSQSDERVAISTQTLRLNAESLPLPKKGAVADMQRMEIILLLIALSLSFIQNADGQINASVQKPNILFIAVDDLNDWAGFMGGHPGMKIQCKQRSARWDIDSYIAGIVHLEALRIRDHPLGHKPFLMQSHNPVSPQSTLHLRRYPAWAAR